MVLRNGIRVRRRLPWWNLTNAEYPAQDASRECRNRVQSDACPSRSRDVLVQQKNPQHTLGQFSVGQALLGLAWER